MPTAQLIRPAAVADEPCESPAGLDDATLPRVARPPFTFQGAGNPHWFEQPCTVLSADALLVGGPELEVVFACGCRAVVPASTLVRVTA